MVCFTNLNKIHWGVATGDPWCDCETTFGCCWLMFRIFSSMKDMSTRPFTAPICLHTWRQEAVSKALTVKFYYKYHHPCLPQKWHVYLLGWILVLFCTFGSSSSVNHHRVFISKRRRRTTTMRWVERDWWILRCFNHFGRTYTYILNEETIKLFMRRFCSWACLDTHTQPVLSG